MRPPSFYSLRFELPVEPDRAFGLLSDPRHLDLLTPPWFRLHPVGEIPETLGVGSQISYRLRWRGLPLRWTSLVTNWRAGELFVYEQQRGPYLDFRHEHLFTPVAGGTAVEDQVRFRAPGGRLADRLVALPDLQRIFEYRRRRLPALLTAFDRSEGPTPIPDALRQTARQPSPPGPGRWSVPRRRNPQGPGDERRIEGENR